MSSFGVSNIGRVRAGALAGSAIIAMMMVQKIRFRQTLIFSSQLNQMMILQNVNLVVEIFAVDFHGNAIQRGRSPASAARELEIVADCIERHGARTRA